MTVPIGPARAAEILSRGAGKQVVVVGDVILDRYLVGRGERLSREGPVPVLAFRRAFARAGGAANPAANLAALGARVLQVGVIGDDDAGAELKEILTAANIDAAGLVVDPGRPTTVKTRVVAEGFAAPQQVARIDHQQRSDVAGGVEAALIAALTRVAPAADAVLVSHYRSGVVTPAMCAALLRRAPDGAHWLTVDAQGDLDRFAGFDLVRVGRQDAGALLTAPLETEADHECAARALRARLGARVVIVGRGADGMGVADDAGYALIRPANVSEVYDVAGAGDTVIAVVTLALVAGAGVREAVALANVAAGIVVRRLGVAAPVAAEILREIETIIAA
jgi:D-glycero-beta-D-manno-heptose-7-phosphate kinase